eukprot:1220262-Rhodomonas_salina.3
MGVWGLAPASRGSSSLAGSPEVVGGSPWAGGVCRKLRTTSLESLSPAGAGRWGGVLVILVRLLWAQVQPQPLALILRVLHRRRCSLTSPYTLALGPRQPGQRSSLPT